MASLMSVLKKAGFSGQGMAMAYAIAMAESGGRAGAHNGNAGTGDNSYGLFQINMLGGMGPERRKRYGLSSNEALYDALTNARVAYKMSNGGKNWGPWSTYKTGAYRQYYGGSSAQVSAYSATSTGGTGTVAALDPDTLAAEYGLSSALINSSRELKSLFKKAVSGSWTASRFQASLRNTKWWTTQSTTLRQYLTQKYEDPATFKQKNSAGYAKYNALAVQVGLGSQISKGAASKLLRDVTYKGIALGWTDARIKDYLGARTGVHDGVMWGEAGDAFDKLHALAYSNGMTYKGWYESTAKGIVSGKTTLEAAEAKIRREAAAKYSAFAPQIMAGQNALDLAAPYISSVSTLLELPNTDVDLSNRYVSDAMTGAKAGSTYPLWEFETKVRSDPLWKKTNNARESMMGTAHQVLQNFGLAW
jgi:hypothetical protein